MTQNDKDTETVGSEDLQKFEMLLDKLIKENKIDKLMLLKKLKLDLHSGGSNAILDEGDGSQFNDVLLDEHILEDNDSQEDDTNIALEAPHHQSSNNNNLYKFRN